MRVWQIGCCLMFVGSLAAEGIPTQVLVRAVSRDAKIIGSGVGGARITIRDAASGEVLAEGLQEGGTGETERIMVAPRVRGETVYDTEGAAGFLTTLELERPTVVEIVAEGPLGTPQSTQRASKTMLVIPGKDVLGDGVLLEIHGFTVTLLQPEAEEFRAGQRLEVRATTRMT